MKKTESIEDFVAKGVDACRLTKTPVFTLMMQAADTDPLNFTSILRIGDENPFGEDPIAMSKMRKVSALLRNRDAAHRAAERMILMEDMNRNPDFVNGYLRISADGTAKLHVHYGTGLTTHVLSQTFGEAEATQDVG